MQYAKEHVNSLLKISLEKDVTALFFLQNNSLLSDESMFLVEIKPWMRLAALPSVLAPTLQLALAQGVGYVLFVLEASLEASAAVSDYEFSLNSLDIGAESRIINKPA